MYLWVMAQRAGCASALGRGAYAVRVSATRAGAQTRSGTPPRCLCASPVTGLPRSGTECRCGERRCSEWGTLMGTMGRDRKREKRGKRDAFRGTELRDDGLRDDALRDALRDATLRLRGATLSDALRDGERDGERDSERDGEQVFEKKNTRTRFEKKHTRDGDRRQLARNPRSPHTRSRDHREHSSCALSRPPLQGPDEITPGMADRAHFEDLRKTHI
jgi:hypothetical protein